MLRFLFIALVTMLSINSASAQRTRLTSNVVVNFDATTSLQSVWDTYADSYDLAGFDVTFLSAPGLTYTNGGLRTWQGMLGAKNGAYSVVIDFNGSTVNMTNGRSAISTGGEDANADPVNVQGVQLTVKNLHCTATLGGCLFSNGATIIGLEGMDFGQVSEMHMRAVGTNGIFMLRDYKISGGAKVHWNPESGSYVLMNRINVDCLGGAWNFTEAFAKAIFDGQAYPNATFLNCGNVTGKKWDVSLMGMVPTFTGDVNRLPGTTGLYSFSSQGWYN
jgi:hypothetical protein